MQLRLHTAGGGAHLTDRARNREILRPAYGLQRGDLGSVALGDGESAAAQTDAVAARPEG